MASENFVLAMPSSGPNVNVEIATSLLQALVVVLPLWVTLAVYTVRSDFLQWNIDESVTDGDTLLQFVEQGGPVYVASITYYSLFICLGTLTDYLISISNSGALMFSLRAFLIFIASLGWIVTWPLINEIDLSILIGEHERYVKPLLSSVIFVAITIITIYWILF